jgi:GAF domain-containing protein
MKEDEILFQISRIIAAATSFPGALERIRVLLEEKLDARALTVVLPERVSMPADTASTHAEQVLEAFDLAYRSLYAVPLRAGGRELGKLIACYASSEFYGAIPQRVSQYAGEQLGMLLERSLLSKDRARLGATLARLRETLAARKVLQRAQGILKARRSLSEGAANLWISQEARRSGLSPRRVAEQIVAGEIAERDAVFEPHQRRIA